MTARDRQKPGKAEEEMIGTDSIIVSFQQGLSPRIYLSTGARE